MNLLETYLTMLNEDDHLDFLQLQFKECIQKCIEDRVKNKNTMAQILRSKSLYNSYEYICKNSKCYQLQYLINMEKDKKRK